MGRAVRWAADARGVNALGAVGAPRAWLARAGGSQLQTRFAFLAALRWRHGLLGASGEAAVASLARELAFVGLEIPVATGAADAHLLVEVPSSSTTLLAVLGRSGSGDLRHALATCSLGTSLAGDLAHLILVGSQVARLTGFALGVIVCARGAIHAFTTDDNLWIHKQLMPTTNRTETLKNTTRKKTHKI